MIAYSLCSGASAATQAILSLLLCAFIILSLQSVCPCLCLRAFNQERSAFITPSIPNASPRRNSLLNGAISGIQPSGELHIGNYIGCIHPAVQYQDEKEDLTLLIADLHATTGNSSNTPLDENVKQTVLTLLACGIDPKKTNIVLQSHIPSILELNWILGTVISLGRLRKLANFGGRQISTERDSVGICLYPLLMAADVLGSGCDTVIAGPDQECHLGLIREVAKKLNRRLGTDVVKVPELQRNSVFRVLSLDGIGKMSKSNEKENTRVNILDDDKVIAEKLRSAKTSTLKDNESPEVANLLRLYSFFSSIPLPEVMNNAENLQFSTLKDNLQQAMSSKLDKIKARYKELSKDENAVNNALTEGEARAEPIFNTIVERIKHHCHYYTA